MGLDAEWRASRWVTKSATPAVEAESGGMIGAEVEKATERRTTKQMKLDSSSVGDGDVHDGATGVGTKFMDIDSPEPTAAGAAAAKERSGMLFRSGKQRRKRHEPGLGPSNKVRNTHCEQKRLTLPTNK